MERLTFNTGQAHRTGSIVVSRRGATPPRPAAPSSTGAKVAKVKARLATARERYDWDYLWMLAFTWLLFFRPQDQIRPLAIFHLSELTAVAGLAALAMRRMGAGQTVVKITPEVIGVLALGGMILLTLPFSLWPGGSLRVFSDVYVKIILIFALMISTLTSPRRLQQMTWLMIVASGYISALGVFDYLRGMNLTEGNRLRGSVGGMFENPNDLALNLVTFLAPTLFIILHDRRPMRRIVAAGCAVLMLAAIVATKSRGGFLGLTAMLLVVGYYTMKVKPGMIFAGLFVLLIAVPMLPQSFWARMDSITNAETDPTGSRAARLRLINQGLQVFADNPVTGIGAGQFENYDGPGAVERNRATHNVWLQVAAELGIFGLLVFAYLVVRAFRSALETLRAMRPRKKPRAGGTAARRSWRTAPAPSALALSDDERWILDINAKSMIAAMVGWFVCAFFASVAFNWTFYYVLALAVAGREIVVSRRGVVETAGERESAGVPRLVVSRV